MKLLEKREEAGVTRRNVSWKLRWVVAERFRNRPGWCWSSVVNWVYRYPPDGREGERLSYAHDGFRCQVESSMHRDRSCYCSKYVDGKQAPK